MSTEIPKFCKDCKWARPFGRRVIDYDYYLCARDAYDLVSGEKITWTTILCSERRDSTSDCGPDARLFEPLDSPVTPG